MGVTAVFLAVACVVCLCACEALMVPVGRDRVARGAMGVDGMQPLHVLTTMPQAYMPVGDRQKHNGLKHTCLHMADLTSVNVLASDSDSEFDSNSKGLWGSLRSSVSTAHKFSRPHTIKGTVLASLMGVIRALRENPDSLSMALVPTALSGLAALLCGNAYIVGINQVTHTLQYPSHPIPSFAHTHTHTHTRTCTRTHITSIIIVSLLVTGI
jgi:hypothetical protein